MNPSGIQGGEVSGAGLDSFPRDILDSLPHRMAVLDARGIVLHANPRWTRAAGESFDPFLTLMTPGSDGFAACAPAAARLGLDPALLLARFRAVLAGTLEESVLEYELPPGGGGASAVLHAGSSRWPGSKTLILSHIEMPAGAGWELARIADTDCTRAAAYVLGVGLLSDASPALFAGLVLDYGGLLDAAVKRRAYKVPDRVAEGARLLARKCCAAKAGPRDVVEVHNAALADRTSGRGAQMQRAYAEESRMLLLEVMGYLASSYRSRSDGPCLQCQVQERPKA